MKKILIFIVLAAIAFGIYYSYEGFFKKRLFKDYTASSELRDSTLKDLTISIAEDTYNSAFYMTAKWTSELEANPNNSSVKMEVVITQTESAKGKKVIASSSMKGITPKGSKTASLMCHVFRNEITPDKPFVWVKISSTINGQPQNPIIKYLGKFK